MKDKMLTLLCFLVLSLGLNLGPAFANEQREADRANQTLFVTDYLDKLRVSCNCGVKEFELMQTALSEYPPHLINPIPKNQALLSSKCYPYWQSFETIVEKAQGVDLDYPQIRNKVEQLIYETKDNEYKKDEARVKTENINIETDFATIPKGTYQNEFIGAFKISQDVDIQTTPVTQYQWTKVMGDNPAEFKTGEDSRQVEINGKQIEMCPNKPVENVSYEMIIEFIKKLNEQDPVYEYGLPSIEEYLALLGNNTQTKGSSCLSQEETCHVEFSSYQYLGNKRIYSISDNVLEFTRDSLQRVDLNLPPTNKILFGFPYYSTDDRADKLSSITKPIYYARMSSDNLGFRLIRYKKGNLSPMCKQYNLVWGEENVTPNKNYIWDKTCQVYIHKAEYLEWMVEFKDRYSKEIQHTIETLLLMRGGEVESLKETTKLYLDYLGISDLTPLMGLTKLEILHLSDNKISDLTPLMSLTKLEILRLGYNEISDIAPLASLSKLKVLRLNMNMNTISDLTPLASLIELKVLELGYNKISDFTPLSGLTKLTSLLLSGNNISDISSLAGLTRLEELWLEQNNISDITPLANLTELRRLVLSENNLITDVKPLTRLVKLQVLFLDKNNISDISPLIGLRKLDELHIEHNNILDMHLLAMLSQGGIKITAFPQLITKK